jgi:hypothetical protein
MDACRAIPFNCPAPKRPIACMVSGKWPTPRLTTTRDDKDRAVFERLVASADAIIVRTSLARTARFLRDGGESQMTSSGSF